MNPTKETKTLASITRVTIKGMLGIMNVSKSNILSLEKFDLAKNRLLSGLPHNLSVGLHPFQFFICFIRFYKVHYLQSVGLP